MGLKEEPGLRGGMSLLCTLPEGETCSGVLLDGKFARRTIRKGKEVGGLLPAPLTGQFLVKQ